MESKDQKQILNSIIQILKNCILSDINIETLSFFDFEYLFLMLRSSSIGNVVQLSLQHKCEGINDAQNARIGCDIQIHLIRSSVLLGQIVGEGGK